ncbi:MAG: DoxX family protein [Acidimicrobiia bacterium]
MGWKNVVLWVLQWVFGIYFIAIGVMHFSVPDGLPAMMEWMYQLDDTMHVVAGIAEILGGVGLILPSVTRIQPQLSVYAAAGLVLVMAGAVVFHANRGEGASIATNVIVGALMVFVAYGRWKIAPIQPRR